VTRKDPRSRYLNEPAFNKLVQNFMSMDDSGLADFRDLNQALFYAEYLADAKKRMKESYARAEAEIKEEEKNEY